MKKIKLTKNKFALIDNKKFELVSQYKWWAVKNGNTWYAETCVKVSDNKYKCIYMHKMLFQCMNKKEIDHINGNGLDNRDKNIRFVTRQQNQANSGKYKKFTSKYKGVYWDKRLKKWRSRIKYSYVGYNLIVSINEKIAAYEYDFWALYFWGEFARINFPKKDYSKYIPKTKNKKLIKE